MIFNKNKIWIDRSFTSDFRYQNLTIFDEKTITLPYSLQTLRSKNKNIKQAFIDDANAKIKHYKFWIFAINLLKPRKIFLRDNLYDNYSLLLAAKITRTECNAISHSPTCRYHMNTFGTSKLINEKNLKFDKIFVYHKIFKNFLLKYGNFYSKNEVKTILWPNNNSYNYKIKKNNKNIYLLYAFEHFCNYKKINEILIFFQSKGHKIIIKKRPDMNNYSHFDKKLKIYFVEDFSLFHIKNCICFLGSTTGLLFNLSQNFIPILFLTDCGYNHFKGIQYPKNWIKIKKINDKIYNKLLNINISKNFVM